jgi:hypothetical protein
LPRGVAISHHQGKNAQSGFRQWPIIITSEAVERNGAD